MKGFTLVRSAGFTLVELLVVICPKTVGLETQSPSDISGS